ncbi:MAG: IS21 family transposase, partial [Candidatus Binataceae bacterium]
MEGKTQEAAAAGAGMSVRSGRHWQAGPYPSQARKPHLWRTRPDPFAVVFDSDIAPLLAADERRLLEARTLLGEFDRRHPGCFSVSQLRTLQRRIREWRALHGPEQEVYFPQDHPPGREAAFDFTNCNDLGVTIGSEPFAHLLFELALSYSGWRWQMVAASESFEALAAGVQGALWELGGVSEVLRSDNLSAATHDLRRSRGRALTRRYRELL